METVRRYDYRTAIKEKAKLTISKDLSFLLNFIKIYFQNKRKFLKILNRITKELNNIIK